MIKFFLINLFKASGIDQIGNSRNLKFQELTMLSNLSDCQS